MDIIQAAANHLNKSLEGFNHVDAKNLKIAVFDAMTAVLITDIACFALGAMTSSYLLVMAGITLGVRMVIDASFGSPIIVKISQTINNTVWQPDTLLAIGSFVLFYRLHPTTVIVIR